MSSDSSHQHPSLRLRKDCLANMGHIAIQANILIEGSANFLESVLRLATIAMAESGNVAETIRSMQQNLDERSGTLVPLSSESIGDGLEFLRGVARQAAQASLNMRKLIGETHEAFHNRQWINQMPGDSICKIQRRLREMLEPWIQAPPSGQEKLPEQLLRLRLTAMLNIAEQHTAVADTALHSVERFQVTITKIVRAIEQGRPGDAGKTAGVDRKLR